MKFLSNFRQEYLGMQSKYAALESKSKILVTQQNHAVSGATIALSDLGSRLNDLVEQLVASYNISEQELEVSDSLEIHTEFTHSQWIWLQIAMVLLCLAGMLFFRFVCSTKGRFTNYPLIIQLNLHFIIFEQIFSFSLAFILQSPIR